MLSIIVPVYNSEKYLEECIQSVINQSYPNWELILINDGSTDNSLEICKKYEALDSRIFVWSQENQGQSIARNKGLFVSKGKYIAFLDSDDTVSEDCYEFNIQLLENNKFIDCVQFPTLMDIGSEKEILRKKKQAYYVSKDDFFILWLDQNIISWVVWDKIYRRDVFNNLRFKEGIVYEDNYFIVDLLKTIETFYISEVGLYRYFFRENSTTNSLLTSKKEMDSAKVVIHILSNINKTSHFDIYIKFLSKLNNIKKSLRHNFSIEIDVPHEIIKPVTFMEILTSAISTKEKIKMLILKLQTK